MLAEPGPLMGSAEARGFDSMAPEMCKRRRTHETRTAVTNGCKVFLRSAARKLLCRRIGSMWERPPGRTKKGERDHHEPGAARPRRVAAGALPSSILDAFEFFEELPDIQSTRQVADRDWIADVRLAWMEVLGARSGGKPHISFIRCGVRRSPSGTAETRLPGH